MNAFKQQAIKLIKMLPDSATLEDVMEELYFKMHVDHGLAELDKGKGLPHAGAEKRLSKWLRR